jgi:uncharacterized membrane protein
MADVNYLEYGTNVLRVPLSFGDLLSFASSNGYVFGVILSIVIILFIVLFVLILFGKKILKTLESLIK